MTGERAAAPEPSPRSSRSDAGDTAPRTARELVERGRAFLVRHGLAEARLDADLLVAHALGLDRLRLFVEFDRPVTATEVAAARELLVRRSRREPVAYLTGSREFYGREFGVGPGVLVPRPETELVVDLARDWAKGRAFPAGGPRVLDVGTGSGCLAVTLALELPGATVVAWDVSAAALARARANAAALGAGVTFRELDALARLGAPEGPFAGEEAGTFDLVVSNPPYVTRAERDGLAADVRDHEPELALFAPDGAADVWAERLFRHVAPRLASGGRLLVELGHTQAPRLRAFAAAQGFAPDGTSPRGFELRFVRDLAGIERVLALDAPDA